MNRCNYLMKETVSVGVAKLSSLVASTRLDGDVDSTDRRYRSSCEEGLCKESHIDDCEIVAHKVKIKQHVQVPGFCSFTILPCHFIRNLAMRFYFQFAVMIPTKLVFTTMPDRGTRDSNSRRNTRTPASSATSSLSHWRKFGGSIGRRNVTVSIPCAPFLRIHVDRKDPLL